MSYSNGPTIVTDGLVLALDAGDRNSYPGSGTTWSDLAGSNNGTLINGPTFSSANGGSIVFDGSDDRANFGTSEILRPTALTLNVWIQSSYTGTGGSTRIIVGYYRSGEGYNMTQYPYTYSNQVNCYIGNGGFSSSNAIQVELDTDTWTNICMTYDGVNQNVYKNGEFYQTKVRTLTYYLVDTYLSMGVHSFSTGLSHFKGSNSITQLYNRALSQEEILQNYNATKGRFGL